jgi:hypothetical protein
MAQQPSWALAFSGLRFQNNIELRHSTVCRTTLDEGSARRRDLYLTTHSTHKIQPSMPPAGFEPATPSSDRSQTLTIDRTANGIGIQ